MEWQDISTAPKDGSIVMLNTFEGVCPGVFDHSLWHCSYAIQEDKGEFGFYGFIDVEPTHWMPLPTPPKPAP